METIILLGHLGGHTEPSIKLAYFVLYLKIITRESCIILFEELKNVIEIFSRPSGSEVIDQNSQNDVWIKKLKNRLAYLNLDAFF